MKHEIPVRATERADLPAIAAVVESTGLFPSDMLGELTADHLEGRGASLWLSGELDGRVAGFVYCQPEMLTLGCWNMLALGVAPAVQGRGLGRRLVEELEKRLSERGERLLLVETSGTPAFEATRRFYLGAGYHCEARIRDYYAAGDDKVIFRKALIGN